VLSYAPGRGHAANRSVSSGMIFSKIAHLWLGSNLVITIGLAAESSPVMLLRQLYSAMFIWLVK